VRVPTPARCLWVWAAIAEELALTHPLWDSQGTGPESIFPDAAPLTSHSHQSPIPVRSPLPSLLDLSSSQRWREQLRKPEKRREQVRPARCLNGSTKLSYPRTLCVCRSLDSVESASNQALPSFLSKLTLLEDLYALAIRCPFFTVASHTVPPSD